MSGFEMKIQSFIDQNKALDQLSVNDVAIFKKTRELDNHLLEINQEIGLIKEAANKIETVINKIPNTSNIKESIAVILKAVSMGLSQNEFSEAAIIIESNFKRIETWNQNMGQVLLQLKESLLSPDIETRIDNLFTKLYFALKNECEKLINQFNTTNSQREVQGKEIIKELLDSAGKQKDGIVLNSISQI